MSFCSAWFCLTPVGAFLEEAVLTVQRVSNCLTFNNRSCCMLPHSSTAQTSVLSGIAGAACEAFVSVCLRREMLASLLMCTRMWTVNSGNKINFFFKKVKETVTRVGGIATGLRITSGSYTRTCNWVVYMDFAHSCSPEDEPYLSLWTQTSL